VEKMVRKIVLFVCVLILPIYAAVPARSEDKKAPEEKTVSAPDAGEVVIGLEIPLFSPLFSEVPLAKINEENLTVKDVRDAVIASHEERSQETAAKKVNYDEILNRLINWKLILQEAREMGIEDLPEVKEAVAAQRRLLHKELLLKQATKDAKADPAAVERIYKNMIREWKIKSVLFFEENDAKKMLEEIKAGKSFEELAAKAVADKKAKGNDQEDFARPADLMLPVAQTLAPMQIGSVSPVVEILAGRANSGWAVIKLVDVRYVDNKEAKEKAEQEALSEQKSKMVQEYGKVLLKKYDVKINKKLLNQLDFEAAKPGLEKLSNDKRVLVRIQGEKAITVGVLTVAVKKSFFHGLKQAIAEKRVNEKKFEVLNSMIDKTLLERDAVSQGVEKTEEYQNKMKEYVDSVVFGTFVEKVVAPDVKLTKEEFEAYYNEHLSEYSTPEMMRLNSLAFTNKEDAEKAAEKLRKGTDYDWMLSNAEGQVKKDAKDLLTFEGNLITISSMPEDLQKVMAGTKKDEIKLYASPGGYYYVLIVKQVVAPESQPLSEVQKQIGEKLFNEKLKDSVEAYAAKLRKAGEVKIYLSKSK
jgi:hypothetical protein